MQHTPLEIKEKLLKAVDKEYNVLDMGTVLEVVSILERTPITKEVLESTRLGKYINELRRKTTNETLARRAKELVRQWRHLIAQPENSMAVLQLSTSSNHLQNGLMPTARLGGTLSPGLPQNFSNSHPKNSISPPLVTANINIPVSPAVSTSSGKSSPTLQFQQSSTQLRHNIKKHSVCPSSPVAYNSQVRTRVVLRPESPGLVLTHVNEVLASDSVPKTHVANKRLRKDVSSSSLSSKKSCQANGGIVNNADFDVACSSVEIVEEISQDSFGATSDRGSVTYQTESRSVLENEVPQDNGLHVKSTSQGPLKKVTAKGVKIKNTFSENSSHMLSVDDIVKEKIASIARIPKVKTTQELLAGLQARTFPSEDHISVNSMPTGSRTSLSNCTLPGKHGSPSDALEMSRNKTEHIAKFLRSHSALQDLHRDQTVCEVPKSFNDHFSLPAPNVDKMLSISRISNDVSQSKNDHDLCEKLVSSKDIRSDSSSVIDRVNEEVTNILSRLPPINYDEIQWDDLQDSVGKVTSVGETGQLVARLYSESVEGISGNCSHENDGIKFREWHETVVRPSYQGELLNILPYVIID